MSASIAQPIAGIAQREAGQCVMIKDSLMSMLSVSLTRPTSTSKAAFALLLDPGQRTAPTTALNCNRFDSLS
jgi:hypothetical protein